MTPSIGRIVHYYDPFITRDGKAYPFAAIVTGVVSNTNVHLYVMPDPNHVDAFGAFGAPSVALGDPENPPALHPFWTWPPRV